MTPDSVKLMLIQTSGKGITFAVDNVERATQPLRLGKTRDSIATLTGGYDGRGTIKVESCSGYNSNVLLDMYMHPLIAAVAFAYNDHRPLVLSPDMIWVAIVQGLALHINNNAEQLRSKLVSHQGKKRLVVSCDILPGSPENDWEPVIHQFSEFIQQNVNINYAPLVSNFSTTGVTERAACEVALMDAFQPYFEYEASCVCGIPEITLEGTPADWALLREKVEALEPFELDWWLPSLRRVSGYFERASRGEIDPQCWQNIYKLVDAYGGSVMNGWIFKLIPYLKHYASGSFTERNSLINEVEEFPKAKAENYFGVEGVRCESLPTGISQAPFILECSTGKIDMSFLGGFVGVEQDEATLALRPKLGWAVCKTHTAQRAFCEDVVPNPPKQFDNVKQELGQAMRSSFMESAPPCMWKFYSECDGLTFPNTPNACTVYPVNRVHYDEPTRSLVFAEAPNGEKFGYSFVHKLVIGFVPGSNTSRDVAPFDAFIDGLIARRGVI
jgi:hypothetical protein